MNTAAFCQVETVVIKTHLEKKGLDVKPCHTLFPLPHV